MKKSKNGQVKMDFRGGRREGAGRKAIGENRALRLVLPDGQWSIIDKYVKGGDFGNYNDFLRSAVADKLTQLDKQFCEHCQTISVDTAIYDGDQIGLPVTSMQLCKSCLRSLRDSATDILIY